MNTDRNSEKLMLFDGLCVFCSSSVRFIKKRNSNQNIEFIPMQSEQGQNILKALGMPLTDYKTLVVIDNSNPVIKSRAIFTLMKSMDMPWPTLSTLIEFIPIKLLDKAYDVLAKSRYHIMGKTKTCDLTADRK